MKKKLMILHYHWLTTAKSILVDWAQFFLKMKAKNQSALQEKLEFISTHPMSNDRIKKSSDFELPDDFKEVPIPLDWELVKEYLY